MKNLMNRVLVVLTISALFAGNISASQAKKGAVSTKRAEAARVAAQRAAAEEAGVNKLGFFELVKKMGEESFGLWTEDARIVAMEKEYGSLDKTPKNLKMFLIGSDTNKTIEFRMKYKDAALKEIANKSVTELTKDLKDSTAALEKDPNNQELQKQVVEQKSTLETFTTTMKSYMTPKTLTAAAIAIVTAAALYYDVCGSYAFLSPYATSVYNAAASVAESMGLGETGYVGGAVRKGLGGVKYYGGQVVGAAKAAPGAALSLGAAGVARAKRALGYETPVTE